MQSLLKNSLLQDDFAAAICQGTLKSMVPIHSPVRMQDYKERQLTRVGCIRGQQSWFPLRRSLSTCQRDSTRPRHPQLEHIHALYGCTGHVYNAASNEQTEKRWDHWRINHDWLFVLKITDQNECWYTDNMTIQSVFCFSQIPCQHVVGWVVYPTDSFTFISTNCSVNLEKIKPFFFRYYLFTLGLQSFKDQSAG